MSPAAAYRKKAQRRRDGEMTRASLIKLPQERNGKIPAHLKEPADHRRQDREDVPQKMRPVFSAADEKPEDDPEHDPRIGDKDQVDVRHFFGEETHSNGKQDHGGAVGQEDCPEALSAENLKKQSDGKTGGGKAEQNRQEDPGNALCFRTQDKRMNKKAVDPRRDHDRKQQGPEKEPQISHLPDAEDPGRTHDADYDDHQIRGSGRQFRRTRPG